MSEAPKKIWIYGKQWQESPEFYPMTFESDKPIVSKEPYIREDLVLELVEAVEEVLRISDRNHDAWDKTKAALAKLEESHE